MPPHTGPTPLSPSELSYLHTSLSLHPPIRPDARLPTSFRPLSAETDLVPSANGSARLCFADGTEAIVGVKAEVERTPQHIAALGHGLHVTGNGGKESESQEQTKKKGATQGDNESGQDSWIDLSLDIPDLPRSDDDAGTVFLAQMIREGLLGPSGIRDRLRINRSWHWRLYIDILLLSPPHTYPLPLLSLSTHLALSHTHLPALISSPSEDPFFNDDWAAAVPLYAAPRPRPPITLLVIAVGENIFFDPGREELAVADAVVAVTVGGAEGNSGGLRLLAVRMIDPPARMAAARGGDLGNGMAGEQEEDDDEEGVWKPRRGGVRRSLLREMVRLCVRKDGVGEEVLAGLGEFT